MKLFSSVFMQNAPIILKKISRKPLNKISKFGSKTEKLFLLKPTRDFNSQEFCMGSEVSRDFLRIPVFSRGFRGSSPKEYNCDL